MMQFKWETAKWDNQREKYLGISVKAPIGRSNIGKLNIMKIGRDVLWYTKPKVENKSIDKKEKLKKELEAIQV